MIDEPIKFAGIRGDVDIFTKKLNVEVKSGNKMNLTQSLKNAAYSKLQGKDYFIYMPKATNRQIYEAGKKGIRVVKNEKVLINAINNQ